MTGSLQIKSGKYYAVINSKDELGKRHLKWVNTELDVKNNKRRAEDILVKLLAEYDAKKTPYKNDILFSNYMFLWLETIASSIEPNTHESYHSIIKRYIEPHFSSTKIKLQDLEPQHIQYFYNGQIKNGLSANSVLKMHANIRKALQHAVKMNIIPYNPADRVTLPKKKEFRANFYTAEQVNSLLDVFGDEAIYPAVCLAAFYGFRRSEVLGLKWNHIDFSANKITVQDVVVRCETIMDKPRTKTKASHRTLPLVPQVSDFLLKLKHNQDANKELLGEGYVENDYVCKFDNGTPFNPNYLTCRFIKVIDRSGLPRIRFHDLRHSAASMLLANGYSLKDIQEWLGHGTFSTTANIYAHLQYQAKQNMADSLGKLISVRKPLESR